MGTRNRLTPMQKPDIYRTHTANEGIKWTVKSVMFRQWVIPVETSKLRSWPQILNKSNLGELKVKK